MKDPKELFVPFALAVRLKKMGFNEPCLACFTLMTEKLMLSDEELFTYKNIYKDYLLAPLWTQVIEWFEKKNIHIEPITSYSKKGVIKKQWRVLTIVTLPGLTAASGFSYRDFKEESLQAAVEAVEAVVELEEANV